MIEVFWLFTAVWFTFIFSAWFSTPIPLCRVHFPFTSSSVPNLLSSFLSHLHPVALSHAPSGFQPSRRHNLRSGLLLLCQLQRPVIMRGDVCGGDSPVALWQRATADGSQDTLWNLNCVRFCETLVLIKIVPAYSERICVTVRLKINKMSPSVITSKWLQCGLLFHSGVWLPELL